MPVQYLFKIYRLCLALLPALETLSFVLSLAVCSPRLACRADPPNFPTALFTASEASANPTMLQLMVLGNLRITVYLVLLPNEFVKRELQR